MRNYIFLIVTVLSISFSHVLAGSWDGMGSVDDPYLIVSIEQLIELADYVNAGNDCEDYYFRLENDVYLPLQSNGDKQTWTPIGSFLNPFAGNFDGNYHYIEGLCFKGGNYVGLFGCTTSSACIKNVYMSQSDGWSAYYMGNICGFNEGRIENCQTLSCAITCAYVIGGIAGVNVGIVKDCANQSYVCSGVATGGIVGFNYGEVVNCSNNRNFDGILGSGGIVGYNGGFDHIPCDHPEQRYAFIDRCENYGSLCAESYTGGICGRNDGYISNCCNNASVKGDNYCGGIVGVNGSELNGMGYVYNSYNKGTVIAMDSIVGGVCGENTSSGVIANVYNSADVHISSYLTANVVAENKGGLENCFDFSKSVEDTCVNMLLNWVFAQEGSDFCQWQVYEGLPYIEHSSLPTSVKDLMVDTYETYYTYEYVNVPPGAIVYTIHGALLYRNNAISYKYIHLPMGVYIMGGRKIIVR